MDTNNRAYYIDWIRVIAIALLLIYHIAIGFQPWGMLIAFITNAKSWESLWIPMMMLNVWRIPLLFFVSGMGVYFALQNRTWPQLLWERTGRILVPFVFGIFCIVPVHLSIWKYYYHMENGYMPQPGHLWFLGNIFVYVLLLSPLFFYLKKNETGKMAENIRKIFSHPLGLLVPVAAFALEVTWVQPHPFEMYAMTGHGFYMGLLAFFFGYCFVLSGEGFWHLLMRGRWFFLLVGILLFALRLIYFKMSAPPQLISLESNLWVFTVLAFGCKYLNRPSSLLHYLSQAAYPVYILHMAFLYLASLLIFPLALRVEFQFLLVLLFTFGGCFAAYEAIRRVKWLRPLLGMKMNNDRTQ